MKLPFYSKVTVYKNSYMTLTNMKTSCLYTVIKIFTFKILVSNGICSSMGKGDKKSFCNFTYRTVGPEDNKEKSHYFY